MVVPVRGSQPRERVTSRTMSAENPVLVRSDRGGAEEIFHRGAVCAWRGGDAVLERGAVEHSCFLRSTAKFFQALTALRGGLLRRHALQNDELALICASHGGEPRHVAVAQRLLDRGGLSVDHLQCGAHWPMTNRSAHALRSAGQEPSALHNNCSGKHSAMLLTAQIHNMPLDNYLDAQHPHQQAVRVLLSEYAQCDSIHTAVDGCSAPTFSMPLNAAARAFAQLAAESRQSGSDAARLADAVRECPGMIAGEGRFCTGIAEATRGRVLAKTGADGYFGAFCRETGTGVALHIDDGNTSASERVLVAALVQLALLTAEEQAALSPWIATERRNRVGRVIGQTRVDLG